MNKKLGNFGTNVRGGAGEKLDPNPRGFFFGALSRVQEMEAEWPKTDCDLCRHGWGLPSATSPAN